MQSLLSKNSLPKASILLQRTIDLGLFWLIYLGYWIFLFFIKRYKIPKIKYLRKQFKSIVQSYPGPLIICSNHLTYIDSVLLIMAFSSCTDYLINFRTMPWNFPKMTHIKKNIFYKTISYLSKCIFIDLDSSHEKLLQPMQIAKELLSQGEYVMLFPEGHRGLNGRVDLNNFTYGVGKLVNEFPNIKILCVYLRGSSQQYSSNFPNNKDSFYIKMKLITASDLYNTINTKRNYSKLRNIRNIANNIIKLLASMEEIYFQQHGEVINENPVKIN